jgi:hypothetical protein
VLDDMREHLPYFFERRLLRCHMRKVYQSDIDPTNCRKPF